MKRAGGSCSLDTISNRHIITKNKLFESASWKAKSEYERKHQWRWVRSSKQVKAATKLKLDFLSKVEATKKLALKQKEEKKKKKMQSLLKVIEGCQKHGGPLTADKIDKLKDLNTQELILEIRFLRATDSPNIKQRSKAGAFTDQQLREQIQNVLKPMNEPQSNLASLIDTIFEAHPADRTIASEDYQSVNSITCFFTYSKERHRKYAEYFNLYFR